MIEEQVITVSQKGYSSRTIMVLIVLLVLIVCSSLYYIGHNELIKYRDSIYRAGYTVGINDGQQALIKQMNADGRIPVLRMENNISVVEFVPIQTICQGSAQ